MSEKVKPCPFCGGKAEIQYGPSFEPGVADKTIAMASCDTAFCPGSLSPYQDTAARIEELEAALAKLDAGTHVLVPVEDVETIWKWLREPDHADAFTMDDLLQWVNSRPGSAAFSIIAAAQEGK